MHTHVDTVGSLGHARFVASVDQAPVEQSYEPKEPLKPDESAANIFNLDLNPDLS